MKRMCGFFCPKGHGQIAIVAVQVDEEAGTAHFIGVCRTCQTTYPLPLEEFLNGVYGVKNGNNGNGGN